MTEEIKRDKKLLIMIVAAVVLKLIAMGLFSSDYQNRMFEPFIDNWIKSWEHGFVNPYQYYYDNGLEMRFPYPVIMLLVMTLGGLISDLFPSAPLFIHNILFKLPLLIFDLTAFVYLMKMFPKRGRKCCVVYLLSPITLYSVFMHGQLDIIPMTLLLISLYYLTDRSDTKCFVASAVLCGLSVLAKFHILAVVPLILIYILKRYGRFKSLLYTFVMCAVCASGIIPFFGEGFTNGVIFNSEQTTLFAMNFSYGDVKLYFCIFAIFAIYLYVLSLNIINRDLLYGFCGIIFAAFLALCVPMPGWYVWFVPFMSVFLLSVNYRRDSLICSIIFNICCLTYFVFLHNKNGICDLYFLNTDCGFLKFRNELINNIGFTLLTASLIFMAYIIFKFGISRNGYYRFHDKSFVIGVCGDSGSGKSTFQNSLAEIFRKKDFLRIEGDGDHRWERGSENWKQYTHLDPKANYLYRQAQDIYKLKNGQDTRRVDYDHTTGKFTPCEIVHSRRFISISGLHTFYLPQLRDIIDLKIYMEADEELRCLWKVNRDSGSRGHTVDDVMAQIRSRYEDSEKYIVPQREYADIIIRYFIDRKEPLSVGMTIQTDTNIDIEPIVDALRESGITIDYRFSDDFRYHVAEYRPSENNAEVNADFEAIASEIIDFRFDITDEKLACCSVGDGIRKLFVLKAISTKLRGNDNRT